MKLLFLAHRIPFPPNKGDKIRAFNVLRYLAARHEVYLACLVDDPADLGEWSELRALVAGIVFERIHPSLRRAAALAGIFGPQPVSVRYFHRPRLQSRIDELIEREQIEAFYCSCSPMAEYLFRSRHASGRVGCAVRVMDLIDVDSFKWQQYAERSGPLAAWIYTREARQLAAYEERIAALCARVLVVSEQEKSYFPAAAYAGKLTAMPNGVDLEFFRPRGAERTSEAAIVFTGVMDYWPNVEGVSWFVDRVFPLIRARMPHVHLLIVGSRPTAHVRRLAQRRGIEVTGYVEDVRSYIERAGVCVAPLRIARGIQNKILEAMAMGKAVVCTPEAFEGIRAQDGRDLVVADGEEAFATATIRLLEDTEAARQIGRAARLCVEAFYSWERNLGILEEILPASLRSNHDQPEPACARPA